MQYMYVYFNLKKNEEKLSVQLLRVLRYLDIVGGDLIDLELQFHVITTSAKERKKNFTFKIYAANESSTNIKKL